jgi:hypothetical protein
MFDKLDFQLNGQPACLNLSIEMAAAAPYINPIAISLALKELDTNFKPAAILDPADPIEYREKQNQLREQFEDVFALFNSLILDTKQHTAQLDYHNVELIPIGNGRMLLRWYCNIFSKDQFESVSHYQGEIVYPHTYSPNDEQPEILKFSVYFKQFRNEYSKGQNK